MTGASLSIREVSARTGVEAATLRMWEQRYSFPTPSRTPSGHRRYGDHDVSAIRRVLGAREQGLSLPAAIESARAGADGLSDGERDSIFAALRRSRPSLTPHVMAKQSLLAISHAIEDECAASALRPLLFASFQRERFYRASESRWHDLARTARCAFVMADFDGVQHRVGAPSEIPIDRSDPAGREWSVVADSPTFTAMLTAWEQPGQDDRPDDERRFEVLWSLEPDLVRAASVVSLAIASRPAPQLTEPIEAALAEPFDVRPRMESVTALTNRMVAYVSAVARD